MLDSYLFQSIDRRQKGYYAMIDDLCKSLISLRGIFQGTYFFLKLSVQV